MNGTIIEPKFAAPRSARHSQRHGVNVWEMIVTSVFWYGKATTDPDERFYAG